MRSYNTPRLVDHGSALVRTLGAYVSITAEPHQAANDVSDRDSGTLTFDTKLQKNVTETADESN
jgi:hypothetical protein